VVFFAAGARTPLLAFLSLRRARNLFVVVFPYVALGVVLVPLGGFAGLAFLALSPAPLIGPRLAPLITSRADRVGALTAGTLLLSLVAMPAAGATRDVPFVVLALGAGVMLAAAPTVRDTFLPLIDAAGYVATAIVLAALAIAAGPALTPFAVALAAAVLVIGVVASAAIARAVRSDALASALGAGLRDPAVAGALALVGSTRTDAAVPLAYALLLGALVLAVWLGKLLVRGEATREASR
jgi:hypothetical protein